MEHTKGPWKSDEIGNIYDSNGDLLGNVEGSYHPFEEDRANANLMAAAPELLESLQGLTRIVDAFRLSQSLGRTQLERLEAAKTVIAKATGAN